MYKYILTILTIFCCINLYAQKHTIPNVVPQTFNSQYYQFAQRDTSVVSVSVLQFHSISDTNIAPRQPAIAVLDDDTTIYLWDLRKWSNFAPGTVTLGQLIDSLSKYVRYQDSITTFVTPKQANDSFVARYTYQVVQAGKEWQSTHIFDDSVGIGGSPSYPLDVQSTGRLYFDGSRLGLYNSSTRNNVLIGASTGLALSNPYKENIAIGFAAQRGATGNYNIGIGTTALPFANGSSNVAIGYQSLSITDSSNNTALGYTSGIGNFGNQNIAVGSASGNFISLGTANINNTEIQVGTSNFSGSGTATFITNQSLSVGTKYNFFMQFNGTPPEPYNSVGVSGLYVCGTVADASTITLNNASLFTTQGTSNTTFTQWNKQNNAIAIGYNTKTDSSNQIKIGNSNNTLLKSNLFVVDISTQPVNGDVYIYNGGKLEPSSESLIPQRVKNMTETERDALTPTTGMIIFNQTSGKGQMYGGGVWNDLW